MMTIAGSDNSGGAGIQADIKTATMLGGYASSVITALTAQNTVGVSDVMAVPADFAQQSKYKLFLMICPWMLLKLVC